MRIITWNMGCAYPGRYRAAHAEAWGQVEALDPDIALLQEVDQVPDSVDQDTVVCSPRDREGGSHTVVYARRGTVTMLGPEPDLAPALLGQALITEVAGLTPEPLVMVSVQALAGSWNTQIILDAVTGVSANREFVVGGDFNLAWRFEETQHSHSASDQFKAMRDQGWLRPHLKFHAGEQRTLFDGMDQLYQLDHFFVDHRTLQRSTRCDVVNLDEQDRLSDHAPLLLEVEGE